MVSPSNSQSVSHSTGSHRLDLPGPDSSNPTSSSVLERFFSNFFQEKNIQWMLIVGAAIVFGSSLMLVTKAWPQWTFSLKYMTVVGYTGVIFAAAEYTRRGLKLNATYRVLQALTMLLLPICFLSLSWLTAGTATQSLDQWAWQAALLVPAGLLLWRSSTVILDHWLRGRQRTFLISFVTLCVAGAVPTFSSPMAGFVFVIVCWIIMTVGVLKINRHTFWLAEADRLPRVFGFLPIAMLGLQFVILVGTKAISVLPIQWIGFATVLTAATILLTARAVADVFRRRTGDLVRPLPWPIIVPLLVGLIVSVIGLALSMVGFSFSGTTTYAVVPTAIVAAITFAVAAWDTKDRWLVWASLISLAIAYQCSPILFGDLVQTFQSATADAINRDRVPFSLYGITYLPLLGTLSCVSFLAARRSLDSFARPIQHFVTTIAIALLAFSATDVVSLFVVAVVNVFMFLGYAIAFRDRRYVVVMLTSLIAAVATCIPAGHSMSYWFVDLDWITTLLAGLACLMTLSQFPDRLLARIPLPGNEPTGAIHHRITQTIGCCLAIATGMHWMVVSASWEPLSMAAIVQFACLITSLVVFTLRVPSYYSSIGCWILLGYASMRGLIAYRIPGVELGATLTYGLLISCVLAFVVVSRAKRISGLKTMRAMRQSITFGNRDNTSSELGLSAPVTNQMTQGQTRGVAFAMPLMDLSVVGLTILFGMFYVPLWFASHALQSPAWSLQTPHFHLASFAISAWLFAIAWVSKDRVFGCLAVLAAPVSISTLGLSLGYLSSVSEVFLVWSVILSVERFGFWFAAQRWANEADASLPVAWNSIVRCCEVSLLMLAALSCLSFDWSMRAVAIIAAGSMASHWKDFAISRKQDNEPQKSGEQSAGHLGDAAILLSLQTLLAAAALGGCQGWLLKGLLRSPGGEMVPYTLLGTIAWIAFFNHAPHTIRTQRTRTWLRVLQGFSGILMLATLMPLRFSAISVVLTMLAMLSLALTEVVQAIKQKSEVRVWLSVAIALVATLFLYLQGIVSFGIGISQFVLLGLGIVAFGVVEWSRRYGCESTFARPMNLIGNAMPGFVAVIAVVREFTDYLAASTALGALAMMTASGIYFYRSLTTGRRVDAVGGVAIANLAMLFLWRSLGWFAPELFLVPIGISVLGLVEVLKDKIPATAHNPLRYIAVLTIMSSPMFEVIGGSWVHMILLMIFSVFVVLGAIGLRLRALVYAGSACLLVDLIAMVVRSTVHNLNVLWLAGVVLGIGVILLAAFCENHRDKLLSRIRVLSAELATWN